MGARTTEKMWREMMVAVAEAGHPGGVNVEFVADRLHGRAGQPEVAGAEQDAEGDHGDPHRGAEGGADGQQHDDAGQAIRTLTTQLATPSNLPP